MNNIADLNNYKSLSKEHIQLGEYDLAIEKLKLCNKNDPKDLETLGLLGDAYVAIQSPKIASEFYEQLLNVDPFNTQALLKFSKIKLKGPNYLEVLKEYHQITKPERYIEIGVCRGASFSLANEETKAIGIDPNPQFEHIGELSANHIVISETSDDYFSCDKVSNRE
ncbi:hypothetical protein GQR58_021232 [Nymphon striatum]|nr:hypothetical protein GQR58_021232 [Nymphon striatum]